MGGSAKREKSCIFDICLFLLLAKHKAEKYRENERFSPVSPTCPWDTEGDCAGIELAL